MTARAALIPDTYRGFDWTNAVVLDKTQYNSQSGFYTHTGSGSQLMTGAGGMNITMAVPSAGLTFSVLSFLVKAAWRDNLNLLVEATMANGTTVTHAEVLTGPFVDPILVTLDGFVNLHNISFSSYGGTNVMSTIGHGPHLAIDDVLVY